MNSQTEIDSKDNDYVKRKEEFTTKLLAFHRARGNPIRRFPLLGGRELNLYHLYTKVQEMGGSDIVTKERNWGEVSRSFNLPSTVTSASYSCRQNYSKFLLEYEQYENNVSSGNSTGIKKPSMLSQSPFALSSPSMPMSVPPVRLSPAPSATATPNTTSASQNSFSMLSSHLSNLLSLPSLQGLGNLLDQLSRTPNQLQVLSNMLNLPPNQVQLLELLMHQRQKQLQSQVCEGGRYDWLVRSLQSGFPNEVDFTLNVLLMMSFDDKTTIYLNKIPQLVDVLLTHVGVFPEGDPYLEELYREEWHTTDELDYHGMWEESVPAHIYSLLLEDVQQPSDGSTQFNQLFPLRSIMSEDHIESFRVSQVSMIMRNLSFDEINGQYLASHEAVLRFLVLGINCSLPMISNHCLDTLVAIAPHLSLQEYDQCFGESSIASLLMASLQELVLSDDRQLILKAVECVGSLAYSSSNIGHLCQLSPDIISRIFNCLLLTDDVQLLITCLDALYCLTFIGSTIATIVLECTDHSVDILINLLTFNYKDCPPRDIVGQISLLHPDGKEEPVTMTVNPVTVTTKPVSKTSAPVTMATKPNKKQTELPQTANNSQAKATPKTTASVVEAKPPVTTATVTSTTSSNTTPYRKPKETKVKLKNLFSVKTTVDSSKSLFGKQWLQTFYKVNPDEFLSKSEMYSRYLSSCAQLKLKTAATQAEFDSMLKEAFPNITFTNIKLAGQDIQLVGGVTKKPLPFPVNQQQQTSKQDSVSRGSSSSSPSRSPSPAPATSLSPLQQLIQQTKSKTLISAPSPKASPLLVSSKMTNSSNNPVIKTGSENIGQLKDSGNILNNKLPNGLSPSKPMSNGNISEEERKDMRKRHFDGEHSYMIPKVKQAKITDADGIATPTCVSTGDVTPTCIATTPSHSSSTSSAPIGSTGTNVTPSGGSSARSSSLPPHISNNNNNPSSSSYNPSKARSLTPPSTTAPELLLDTLRLVNPVATTTTVSSLPGTIQLNTSTQNSAGLICLWNNCLKIKSSSSDLFYHVVYDHLLSTPQPVHAVCGWSGCPSKAKRMLPSLLRHVQIHHCSGSYKNGNKPTPPNVAQTLLRLRTVPKWEVDEESSIAKTIHLTAALVLRNLLETVPHAKLRLSPYESVLTQIVLSSSEASGAVAQCLYLLTSPCSSPVDSSSPCKQFC